MRSFLQSRTGMLCLVGFVVFMAFMFMRVLSQESPPRQEAKATAENSSAPKNKVTEKGEAKAPKAANVLEEDLRYLDRVKDPSKRVRSDRDREGLAVTRRRTSSAGASTRKSVQDKAEPSSPKGGLRLQGRPGSGPAQTKVLIPKIPAMDASEPDPKPAAATAKGAGEALHRGDPFVPYGRPIRCELVFTIDSTMEETPLVGLITEPVFNNGLLCLPAGTEVHGTARPDRLRDRIFSAKDWIFVLPREGMLPNGRQLAVKGLALDREELDLAGLSWSLSDGSNGLRGQVIRSMESAEIKRFAATFLSAAALTLQEREGGGRSERSVANTPSNAALAGFAGGLDEMSRRISAEIEKNGVFIRVPGGKQFYFYPQQSIDLRKASLP